MTLLPNHRAHGCASARYGVVLADPAWRYDHGLRGCAADQYPTMGLEDICALPVASLAADDSVLLLWATWPKLTWAVRVVEAWGFRYVTGFPWIKVTDVRRGLDGEVEVRPQWGIGWWARGASEPLLIGKRGKVRPPERDFVALLCPNVRHSRKPDDIYEFAEAMPGPYIELFARRRRPGWHAWGNEVECDIDLPLADARERGMR